MNAESAYVLTAATALAATAFTGARLREIIDVLTIVVEEAERGE